jgi:hypothetical protein
MYPYSEQIDEPGLRLCEGVFIIAGPDSAGIDTIS